MNNKLNLSDIFQVKILKFGGFTKTTLFKLLDFLQNGEFLQLDLPNLPSYIPSKALM